MKRSPMPRARKPLCRRTPLRATRRPQSAAKTIRRAIPPNVRHAVLGRSEGVCEVEGCIRRAEHMHHRLMRSQGGKDTEANLLHVCWSHHFDIHANPADSYRAGYLIRRAA